MKLSEHLPTNYTLRGFDFSYVTEEYLRKLLRSKHPVLDYDFSNDEWVLTFPEGKDSGYSTYYEWQYSIGKILGSHWDKDIHGWRYPGTSRVLSELLDEIEKQKKSFKWAVKDSPQSSYARRYYDLDSLELTEIAKAIAEGKRNAEAKLVSLQTATEEHFDSPYHKDFPLMIHQQNGITFVLSHQRCLVADDMGTGKTLTGLEAAKSRHDSDLISRVVVLAPNTAKYVWKEQAEKYFPNEMIPIMVNGSTPFEARIEKMRVFYPVDKKLPVYIMTYETARTHPVELQNLLDDGMLILDECHKIKSPRSIITNVVHKLVPKFALLLTGTPIVNKPEDAWSIFHFIRPGIAGRSYDEFQNKFMFYEKDYKTGKTILKYRDLEKFNARVKPLFIRRMKKDVLTLPPKLYNTFYAEMEGAQLEAYRTMATEFRATIMKMTNEEYTSFASNIPTMILRLLQICDGYISAKAPTAEWVSEPSKMKVLNELLEEYFNGIDEVKGSNGNSEENHDRKIVIFSRFIPPLQMLQQELAKYEPVIMYGGLSDIERQENLIKFKESKYCRIFLGQIHTGGLGIDLSVADTVIFFDRWWAPGIILQAEDRLHRKGQTHTVNVIHLVAKAEKFTTVDDYYYKMLQTKKNWADTAIDTKQEWIPDKDEFMKLLDV